MLLRYKTVDAALARKLKWLGLEVKSKNYWVEPCQSHGMIESRLTDDMEFVGSWSQEHVYPAYDVAELGRIMPAELGGFNLTCTKLKAAHGFKPVWLVDYEHHETRKPFIHRWQSEGHGMIESTIYHSNGVLAQAMGMVLVELLERKLVNVEELNKK